MVDEVAHDSSLNFLSDTSPEVPSHHTFHDADQPDCSADQPVFPELPHGDPKKMDCLGAGGPSLPVKANYPRQLQVISRTGSDPEHWDLSVFDEEESALLPVHDGESPILPIAEFSVPPVQVHALGGAPPPPPPSGTGGTAAMCEDEDSEMGEEERETSRSRTHDYGPVPRGGRRASSRTRGTSYDAVLGEPTAGAHGQKSSQWRYKRVIRNHGQGNARSISRGAARDSRPRGQNKEQCDRDVSFAETELYPGPNSFIDEPEGANEMPVDTDDNRDMTAARDESNNRNKMASDVRAEVSHRMPNGLTHESEAYQQPLSQAYDMTVDGEYVQVDYNPMKNEEQGCESDAGGATRREQEILEQTRKCIAEKDELMHNTATAIRVEAAQAVAVHHEALRIEFEENKERMKAALAAEAAEEIRIAAENSHRAREQALLEKALADEARAEQARVIKAAEKMRLEAQTEVNAAGLEARVARAERDREVARADHILQEAQSQVARTTQQLRQAEEARAADCAKLEEVKREAHRIIKEETDVASAAGKAVASAEHRSQRMADEARVLERQKRLAEDRRAEAERVAKDAAVTTKAHEQAIKHAVMVKEAGHAQELAAMKACAAEAEARSMKLVQELRKREESASRSAERESKNPSANAELIK